jgi:uncharacterized coiled-coil protein SlyX
VPKRGPGKIPGYLKSVAQPLVIQLPDKSFGLDENGRPIMSGRSDQEIAADLKTKQFLMPGKCPHKLDPIDCLLCGTREYVFTHPAPIPVDIEDEVRHFLGINKLPVADTAAALAALKEKNQFDYFPALLNINRMTMVELFDITVTTELQSVGREKALKPRSEIEKKITELEHRLGEMEKRIEELDSQIEEEKELYRSMFAHIQKIQVKRGERQPDDVLDQKTRDMYKREAKRKIEQTAAWDPVPRIGLACEGVYQRGGKR